MRLFINEFARAWKNPKILGPVIIACLAAVLGLKITAGDGTFFYTPGQYREAWEAMEDMEEEEIRGKYAGVEQEYGIYDYSAEAVLEREIAGELYTVLDYEGYLSSVETEAGRITSVSIFADKDSFAYRNAVKTAEDYAALKGTVETVPGPSKGVELVLDSFMTAVIIMLVMLVFVNELVVRERESGQMNLLSAALKGRGPHCRAKLLTCLVSSFMVTGLITVSALLTAEGTFGLGDLSRPIQSVSGFRGCTLRVSVGTCLLLCWILQSLAVFTVTEVMFMCAITVSSPVAAYACISLAIGAESVMYYAIDARSYLAFFRNLNLVTFVNTGSYVPRYLNISLFGQPVGYLGFVCVAVPLTAALLFPVNVRLYSARCGMAVQKGTRFAKGLKAGRNVSLFRQESYKLLACGGVALLLLAFAGFKVCSYTPMKEYFGNSDEIYLKSYLLQLEGPVTEEKLEWMEAEEARYSGIREEMMEVLSECPPELTEQVSMQYNRELEGEGALRMLKERVETLQQNGGYIVYDTGYSFLTFGDRAQEKELTMAIIAGIMTVLCITFLFAGDDQIRIDSITSTCIKGRRHLYVKKYLLGLLVLLCIFAVDYAPYIWNVFELYGAPGITFPAGSVMNLTDSVFASLEMPILAAVILCQLVKFLCMTAVMFIISFISRKLRSLSHTMVVSLCIFVGPLLIIYVVK